MRCGYGRFSSFTRRGCSWCAPFFGSFATGVGVPFRHRLNCRAPLPAQRRKRGCACRIRYLLSALDFRDGRQVGHEGWTDERARCPELGCRVSVGERVQGPASGTWRLRLRRLAAGPLLFPACLAAAALAFVIYSVSTRDSLWGSAGSLVLVGAAVLHASTWLAAILFGRTRQLRSGWFMV